jgi:hypothetical protein
MDEDKQPADDSSLESDSLETGGGSASTDSGSNPAPTDDGAKPPKLKGGGIRNLLAHVNIYLLAFVLLLVLAGSGGGIFYLNSTKQAAKSNGLKSQTLSTDSLKQLANSDVTVGDSKQVLTVQSNAIFDGSVLLRGDVEVAGKLVVGDKLSLTGINVGGQSTLQDVNISNNLAVTHDVAIKGKLTVQGALSVNGNVSFNNGVSITSLTVNSLTLNSKLVLTHHIVAGGGNPSRSSGTALGGGGTTSVSGSDTAGTIRINTGSSPAAGCFITVNFTSQFDNTPHVVVTPIGSGAAGLEYYVSRNTGSFSVCTASSAPAHSSFSFDYIAID